MLKVEWMEILPSSNSNLSHFTKMANCIVPARIQCVLQVKVFEFICPDSIIVDEWLIPAYTDVMLNKNELKGLPPIFIMIDIEVMV